jgi:ornithine decarboxylase
LNDGVYNSFNCILYDYRIPIILPFNQKNGILHKSILFGPTCDSIDLIMDNIMLPEMNIGEYLYVENFGAYTVSASSEFNGIKKPINKCPNYANNPDNKPPSWSRNVVFGYFVPAMTCS